MINKLSPTHPTATTTNNSPKTSNNDVNSNTESKYGFRNNTSQSDSLDLDKKYIVDGIRFSFSINDIRNNIFATSTNYAIFEHIFVNPTGIFADTNNPTTQAIQNALINLIENDKLYPSHNYKVFEHVFVNRTGIFADTNNPTTQAIQNALINLIRNDKLYSNHNDKIFEHVFVNQTGIFADTNNLTTKSIQNALINLFESISSTSFKDNYLINLIATNKSFVNDYKIFEHVFINQTGIFADATNPITKAMRSTVIKLIENNKLDYNGNYKVFEHVFVTRTGIFANTTNSDTKDIQTAVINLIKKNNSVCMDMGKVFDYYLNDQVADIADAKIVESAIVHLLINNKIQEPEVIKKLATRFANGLIDVKKTNQNIDFFIKLCNATGIDLMNILFNNVDYFIEKDGLDKIKGIVNNQLLITPLEHTAIKQLTEQKLINDMKTIKMDINEDFIKTVIIHNLQTGIFRSEIDNIVKSQIKELGDSLQNNTFHNINDENLTNLLQTIKEANNSLNPDLKLNLIKLSIKAHLFNNIELTNEQEADVNEFALMLSTIDITHCQKKYIQDAYLPLLGIEMDKYQHACEIISKYFNWGKVINELKLNKYAEICEQVIAKDEALKKQAPELYYVKKQALELYYDYVLSTLPYRSYSNILNILQQSNIPEIHKQKLECVVTYCKLNDFDEDSTESLNVFIVENKNSKENILLSIQDLEYLNNKNINGFTLEQFKVNLFTDVHYQNLKNTLDAHSNLDDNEEIDCSEFGNILFNNLEQINSNSDLPFDIREIITNFSNEHKITKANLAKIVSNETIKTYLKEIESQPLGLNHFDNISFPQYLQNLINNKFTAGNIAARHIFSLIKQFISQYKFKISSEQSQKLEEVCYQVALDPGKDITIAINFKKKLIYAFEDFNLLEVNSQNINDDLENQTRPSGDFILLKRHVESAFTNIHGEDNQLEQLPHLVIEKAENLAFTKTLSDIITASYTLCVTKIIDELFNELNQLPTLKDKIAKHDIAYILGIIFMDMSSVHALGYHVGNENTAFARFRMLGAYFLAKSITLNNNDDANVKNAKLAISKEIKQAILDVECSGQIFNKLYGEYCKDSIKNTYYKNSKLILQAKAI